MIANIDRETGEYQRNDNNKRGNSKRPSVPHRPHRQRARRRRQRNTVAATLSSGGGGLAKRGDGNGER